MAIKLSNLFTVFPLHPHKSPANLLEKIKSGFAGGLAILALSGCLHLLPQFQHPVPLMVSMAASAVLLFAVPHSPLSQPWNLMGGHLISCLCAWACMMLFNDPVILAGLAVGSAIFFMYLTNSLHPPGAATALAIVTSTAIFQPMGLMWSLLVVGGNAGIGLILALTLNNVIGGRRYPALATVPKPTPQGPLLILPEQADIEWVLSHMDSMIDVSAADLHTIYFQAQLRAQSRHDQSATPPAR